MSTLLKALIVCELLVILLVVFFWSKFMKFSKDSEIIYQDQGADGWWAYRRMNEGRIDTPLGYGYTKEKALKSLLIQEEQERQGDLSDDGDDERRYS